MLWLTTLLLLEGTAAAIYDYKEPINCRKTGYECTKTTCRFVCKYSCCVRKFPEIQVIGSGTYLANSSICRSALHDLRFRPDATDANVTIHRFREENCSLHASLRYGVASVRHQSGECEVFQFVSDRVSEELQDVVSLMDDNGTQTCLTPRGHPKVRFAIYGRRDNCSDLQVEAKDVGNEQVEFAKSWPDDPLVAGYQCFANKTALSVVTAVATRKGASFVPARLTVWANKLEDVSLSMEEVEPHPGRATVWRKDGEEVSWLPDWNSTRLRLERLHPGASGIYSLSYADGDVPGYVQLIVRACAKDKYGPNCSGQCPSCSHGGVCHDITGECVCAPGFNGTKCEKDCAPGHVGRECSMACVGSVRGSCKGLVLCLPSPYGCSCASGYKGISCDERCAEPFYGAGCVERHSQVHYQKGTCSRFSDDCTCLRGWHGRRCNQSYPVLSWPPELSNLTESSAVVSFSRWSEGRDRGSGSPALYEIVYKAHGDEAWQSGGNVSEDASEGLLEGLRPRTEYRVAVVVLDRSGGRQDAGLEYANFTTLCEAPAAPPSNVHLRSDENTIYVTWELPPRDEWNCGTIDSAVRVHRENDSRECARDGEAPSCSFPSEHFVTWTVEVCATSGGGRENCAPPLNHTIVPTEMQSPVQLEKVIRAESVTLKWIRPKSWRRLSGYGVRWRDQDTGRNHSDALEVSGADCGEQFHCYTLEGLQPGHTYVIEIVADGEVLHSVNVTTRDVSAPWIYIVCISLILLILAIVALLVYRQRRKRARSALKVRFMPNKVECELGACNEALDEMELIDTESLAEGESNPVPLHRLQDHAKAGGHNIHLRKEFMSVPTGSIYPCSAAKLPENKARNRYGNILPYDHSRVVLEMVNGDPSSTYIHASYIDGYNKEKKYIATQGPMPKTVNDFWRMVWDEGCFKILMITNFMENGKYKCEKYWTEGSAAYGDVTVTLEETRSYADFVVRTFRVAKGECSREVRHFHFTTWPDHGAPSSTAPFRYYLERARRYRRDAEPPIVVHCSAGVGRTGTTILLDSMLDMGRREKHVDLVTHLCSMRKQRMNIVENFDQYVFVYRALVEGLSLDGTCVRPTDFKMEPGRIEAQFLALDRLTCDLMHIDVQGAYQQENVGKNRSMLILPPDRARPLLARDSTAYINAVFVDSFRVKNASIATQYPLPDTLPDFWSMVYAQRCRTVLLLQQMDSTKEGIPQLWSSGCVQAFGDLEVTWKADAADEHFTIVQVHVCPVTEVEKVPLEVQVLSLKGWSWESELPADPSVLLAAVRRVNREATGVVTAVCTDGVTGCGVFCACAYVLDQLSAEPEEIDVLHAVQCIRANRPHFILDLAQYQFIHRVMESHLETLR